MGRGSYRAVVGTDRVRAAMKRLMSNIVPIAIERTCGRRFPVSCKQVWVWGMVISTLVEVFGTCLGS